MKTVKKMLKDLIRRVAERAGYHVYDFPMAAVGNGTIYYRVLRPRLMLVGCASRSTLAGKGYGLSNGGFAELGPMFAASKGTVVNVLAEAWREATEEMPGVETIIRKEDFFRDAQHLVSILVRTGDVNKIHEANFYGYAVTKAQEELLVKVDLSDETDAPLRFARLEWDPGKPEQARLEVEGELYHRHEIVAFRALAVLAERQQLRGREAA